MSSECGVETSCYICLRSRPVDPDVVCSLVSDNVENEDDRMTGVTE